jgi:CubicO group peptidase (beta-lactamase class C family)
MRRVWIATRWLTVTALLPILVLSSGPTPAAQSAQAPADAAVAPPPAFTDSARRSKLATAFPDIDRIFTEFAQRSNVPGAAWGIVVDGELVHSGVTGLRDAASKAAVEKDTVFRIASMTKSFTAMSILKLRDDGKLSLEDPAEKYVPELKGLRYPSGDSRRITIRDLLSHAEGFPEDNAWGDRHLADTQDAFSKMMQGGIPFSNTPGVAYEYSNYGFAILGRIVSRVSGQQYNDYVAQTILKPLGMSSTTYEPSAVPPAKLALGHKWQDGTWAPEPLLADGAFGAMGGMLTTVPDLAKYVAMLLDAWPPRDQRDGGPVRRSSLREMQQVARPAPATVTRDANGAMSLNTGGYGFGLRVSQTCAFGHVVAHSGGLPGFGSQMRWLPEYGVGIIAFGNLTYTGWNGPVTAAFDRLAQTGGLQPRVVQPAPVLVQARDVVSSLVNRWDDQQIDRIAADNLYLDRPRELRKADMAELRTKVGICAAPTGFDYLDNALRGEWMLRCERGDIRASITLAPTMPARVQTIQLRPVPSGTPPVVRRTCPE